MLDNFGGDTDCGTAGRNVLSDNRAGANEVEEAEQVRLTGGISPDRQIQIALFLTSERSNHLTGKLINVSDDLKRLETENTRPDAWTLRRHLK